jgi:hypothetical protein
MVLVDPIQELLFEFCPLFRREVISRDFSFRLRTLRNVHAQGVSVIFPLGVFHGMDVGVV